MKSKTREEQKADLGMMYKTQAQRDAGIIEYLTQGGTHKTERIGIQEGTSKCIDPAGRHSLYAPRCRCGKIPPGLSLTG